MQKVVRHVDPELPLDDIRSMETRIADSLLVHRSSALLSGLFSFVAILLTAVGTYGVLSYAVAQRRREIGVRMALGARPEQIRGHFLVLAVRLLAAGMILGLIGGRLTSAAMGTLLFQVPPFHVPTFAGAAAVVAVVSLVACVLPSCRAARISPLEALTQE
jgi:ABC-type antimicrobial peptide transport system permease subunit